jgi:membrane protein YqaA with SNARE-associated domain
MHDLFAVCGYPSLFLLSFLASTLLPLGSEWLLVAMIVQQRDPLTVVLVATCGNCLGACTSYAIGLYGGSLLAEKLLRIDAAARLKAESFFRRYGSWSLLFSWLPVVGDPLCLVGGVLRIPFTRFSFLVATGKVARYALVAWLALRGMESLPT